MKNIFLLFTLILVLSCGKQNKENSRAIGIAADTMEKRPQADYTKTKAKAKEALNFCEAKKFNTDFCILIDMSLHSGIKRFFVWDFNKNSISEKFLVGHGCGANSWSKDDSKDQPRFSNEDGSHLSSLGKYKLEGRGYSEWGINVKYLMHGLEETNSNALKRYIVFHSWNLMDDEEIFPKGSPEGWGCPTVSDNAMRKIDPLIQSSEKPVLMWIYN